MGIPSPPYEWSSFSIGPLTIHTYALMIVLGIILATIWTNKRLTARGGEPWVVIDLILWTIPLGLLGARLYHVFTHPADYFYEGADLLRVFYIWEGGNAIIGGLIGGAIGAWIATRHAGIRLLSFGDALAPALLLAQGIGRLGNYFNHELYGWPTDLPWGLQIEYGNPAWPEGLPEGTLFHPTFLYEMIWNFIGIGVILLLERLIHLRWGRALAVYLIWYGIGRMGIESIRVDYSEIILGLRSNVLGALILVLIGIALFVVQSIRHRELETSIYFDGRGPNTETDESEQPDEDEPEADDAAEDEPEVDEDSEPNSGTDSGALRVDS